MDATLSSGTLANFGQTARYHIPEKVMSDL
jgi:hypothetical protein